jgi:aldehyde:ferredoxin oxidoreductase
MINVYAGQILRVDLNNQKLSCEMLDPMLLRTYIGQAGLGAKILYDEVPAHVDAYSTDNKLVLMTGPLTGTEIPGAVGYSFVTKSPFAGFPVAISTNGSLGRKLKFAGFDGIIFEGISERWCYLLVEDGQSKLLDASDLLGKDTYDTHDILKARHGASAVVGCIGPAGEKLVRFSGFLAEKSHCAKKGGLGSVFGSKKLKGIVVKSRNKDISIFDENLMVEVLTRWRAIDDKMGLGATVSSQGMYGNYEAFYNDGLVPVKNLTTNDFEGHERLNYESVSQCFQVHRNSCPNCVFNHKNRLLLEGEDFEEPCFDGLAGYGPNIGISDPVQVIKLHTLVHRLGLEFHETAWLLSLLMECYEESIIGPGELDGLKLQWGDYQSVISLLEKIAHREGCGDRFAEGVYQAAQLLGSKALERAVYCKRGFVPQVVDMRNNWPCSASEAISNLGHSEAFSLPGQFIGGEGEGLIVPTFLGSLGTVEEIALNHTRAAPRTKLADILGICLCHGASGDIQLLADALKATTGIDFDAKQLFQVGLRFITLMRLYAVQSGCRAEDDTVSSRFMSSALRGPNKGKSFAKSLPKIRQEYYRLMGWDNSGVPLPQTLSELEIE